MAEKKKACDGGRVLEDGDFAECAECGTRIRWDLREDAFWGFQNCREKAKALAAVDPHVPHRESRPRATEDLSAAKAEEDAPAPPPMNRADIVNVVKHIRQSSDLANAVDIAIAHLVKHERSPADV